MPGFSGDSPFVTDVDTDFITSSAGWPASSDGYDYASLHQDLFWA